MMKYNLFTKVIASGAALKMYQREDTTDCNANSPHLRKHNLPRF